MCVQIYRETILYQLFHSIRDLELWVYDSIFVSQYAEKEFKKKDAIFFSPLTTWCGYL